MELGINLAEILAEFSNGLWKEAAVVLLNDEVRARRLRICVKNGWLQKGPPIQDPDRWAAYRITPKGMAALDQFRLKHSGSPTPWK